MTAAALALTRHEPAKALELLEPVRTYDHAPSGEFWPAYLRGQAYLQAKDGAAAGVQFQSILDHRGEVPASVLYPLAHLGLARAAVLSQRHGKGPQDVRGLPRSLERRRLGSAAVEGSALGVFPTEVKMTTKRSGPVSELFPMVYGELRRVAGRYLRRERRNHTLQPTALVHEAWMKLQNDRGVEWQGRTQGLALGAQAMRRLLVDHGRHQKREKRGGGAQPVALDDLLVAGTTHAVPVEDLLTLEAALTRLEAVDPRGAQVVILRFFSGMSSAEVAEHLGLSVRTVEGDWTHARAWLKREVSGEHDRAPEK